jgi:D-amino-acid oxidase
MGRRSPEALAAKTEAYINARRKGVSMSDSSLRPPVTIIGAGVSGLSCGVLLRQASYPVTVLTKDPPHELVSSKAGAIWFPYHASPPEFVRDLAMTSYHAFARLAHEYPESGVSMVTLTQLYKRPAPEPYWLAEEHAFQRLAAQELPAGFSDGYTVRVPFIDTSRYMPYLQRVFKAHGGIMVTREVKHLSEVVNEASIVINCAGLGTRQIADDATVYPIRGQILRTEKLPAAVFLADDTAHHLPTYVFSRADDCLLGGTVEAHDWNDTVSDATQASILQRCQALEPRLANVAIVGSAVGLRPGRHRIRLELVVEAGTGNLVIHNYGHGGSGFTVSWGCAEQVLLFLQHGLRVREALQPS